MMPLEVPGSGQAICPVPWHNLAGSGCSVNGYYGQMGFGSAQGTSGRVPFLSYALCQLWEVGVIQELLC